MPQCHIAGRTYEARTIAGVEAYRLGQRALKLSDVAKTDEAGVLIAYGWWCAQVLDLGVELDRAKDPAQLGEEAGNLLIDRDGLTPQQLYDLGVQAQDLAVGRFKVSDEALEEAQGFSGAGQASDS